MCSIIFKCNNFLINVNAKNIKSEDNAPPIFNSIKADKNQVGVGEEVNIFIDAIDDDTYISQSTVEYCNEETNKSIVTSLAYNEKSKNFQGKLHINDYFDSGEWKIDAVRLQDIEGNEYIDYQSENILDTANFTVLNDKNLIDVNAPIIKNISFDKESYKVGELMRVSIEAEDLETRNLSIIGTVRRKGSGLEDNLVYNEKYNRYEGVYKITNSYKDNPFNIWASDSTNFTDRIEKNKYRDSRVTRC